MESIFEVLRNVILSKKQSVGELTRRIDVFYAQGKITETEKAELDQMVFDNQTVDAEREELEVLYKALVEKYNALEVRVRALEGGESGGGSGTDGGYPNWEPWDGVSINYQPGAIVKHNGKIWKNVLDGMQNIWEPGVVDNRYWIEVTEG